MESFSSSLFYSLAIMCCFVSNKTASSKKLKAVSSSDKECRSLDISWDVAKETALLEC